MRKPGIERVEAAFLKKEPPEFHIGDSVDVGVRILEGEKERTQLFSGVVIARRGGGATETFTVRRIVAGEGVERAFPLHAPSVVFVRTVRAGRVRRAKLNFLRDRIGKATRLTEGPREAAAVDSGAAPPPGADAAANASESGA